MKESMSEERPASAPITPAPIMSVAELDTFMDVAFPQMRDGDRLTVIEGVGPMSATLRLRFSDRNLRPGGTISGPAMMALADYAMYAVVLAHIGPVALAVTTNLNITFCASPAPLMSSPKRNC